MMHRAWSSIVEVPYCFSRSSVKFQGHTALKIVEFDPNWAFPDCNSSLNSPMAMKCCTQLETAKERCPIVFQGHPSNFKVTQYKTSPILTQIGRFRTIGQSQLSNPSDLPCLISEAPCEMNQRIVFLQAFTICYHLDVESLLWFLVVVLLQFVAFQRLLLPNYLFERALSSNEFDILVTWEFLSIWIPPTNYQ